MRSGPIVIGYDGSPAAEHAMAEAGDHRVRIEKSMQERAQRLAQKGASVARDAGFDAEGLAVADDVDVPVSETIVNVARERDAQAIVLGAHGHGRAAEVIVGSTTRDVVRHAPCPVLVVREPHG